MSADVFLAACTRQPTPYTPVWFMRQAGRYLPEYRAIRAAHSLLDICHRPPLAAEVTLQPIERLGVDAAVLFADILLPFEPLGLGLSFTKGEGPAIARPVRTAGDVARLPDIDPHTDLGHVLETVRLARNELQGKVPLIGFAGAPFTLASYAIEGGPTRSFVETKRLMYRDPDTWHALLDRLAAIVGRYLAAQIEAGAQAVQLFDSWVGCLSPDDYRHYVLPHSAKAIRLARQAGSAPIIHFGTETATLLELMAEAGGDVIGVDWRIPLDQAWTRLPDRAIQGNLDPAALLAPLEDLQARVRDVLRRAGGRPGHVFNLGHGVLPQTDPERLRAVVEMVHEWTERGAGSGARGPGVRPAQRRTPDTGHRTPFGYAVLLLAYGAPGSLEEVEPYLLDVRGGRPTPPDVVQDLRARYAAIGGASPLLHHTREQARALAACLNGGISVYVGMRHWHPFIRDTLDGVRRDGIGRVVAIAMAPHFSRLSIGAYQRVVDEARGSLEVVFVPEWGAHPAFLEAVAARVREGLARFAAAARPTVPIVFTAHSLPERSLTDGDPYAEQLRASVAGVLARIGEREHEVAFQSAGRSDEPWLGPAVIDVVTDLSERGHQHVLVCPIGFVADHLEVLYDIDVELADRAKGLGIRLERTPSLNAHPMLIGALKDLVQSAVQERGWG